MNILFLDIDGVMNCRESAELSCRYHVFDRGPTLMLSDILQKTRAHIVISSSWRVMETLETLRDVFAHHGFDPECILGVTPRLSYNDPHRRGLEIGEWITENAPPNLIYAILDDCTGMGTHMGRLIQTDNHVGLTRADADRVIALLNERHQ